MMRWLRSLWRPPVSTKPIGEPLPHGALEFTREEWQRPHRLREDICGFGHREWDAFCMNWIIFDNAGNQIGRESPDHARTTPEDRARYQRGISKILGREFPLE